MRASGLRGVSRQPDSSEHDRQAQLALDLVACYLAATARDRLWVSDVPTFQSGLAFSIWRRCSTSSKPTDRGLDDRNLFTY